MKVFEFLRPERKDGYTVRLKSLRREIELLRSQIERLKDCEPDDVMFSSLFDSAVIRGSKLIRNSGFTMHSFREYVRQSLPRAFRRDLYRVLDDFEREETLLGELIMRLKNCRDRVIVHMDPRFAFHPERAPENAVQVGDLEAICNYLERHIDLFDE
jgi:DNA-binding Xre family transcriptional regulator